MDSLEAVELLKKQKQEFSDSFITLDEWITSTSATLVDIFPLSGRMKVSQVKDIKNIPPFLLHLSENEKAKWRKTRIDSYLNNYIEEIEVFGLEEKGENITTLLKKVLFFGSHLLL